MPREIFMGLTTTDFGSSLKNNLGYACIGFAGAAVAGLTAALVIRLLRSKEVSRFIGTVAGTAASRRLVRPARCSRC